MNSIRKNRMFSKVLAFALAFTLALVPMFSLQAYAATTSDYPGDPLVAKTQEWLNANFTGEIGYTPITVNGKPGWTVTYALLNAFQITLGIHETFNSFGPTTTAKFNNDYTKGVYQQADGTPAIHRMYGIIEGALWCKGYGTGENSISMHFYSGIGDAIKQLKSDAGLQDKSSVATIDIMKALLSMDQFKIVPTGTEKIRYIQRDINNKYESYVGLIPCDGIYSREMNTAMIKVLQAIEGYSPEEAKNGNFGDGTKSKLVKVLLPQNSAKEEVVNFLKYCLCVNGYESYVDLSNSTWDENLADTVKLFRIDMNLTSEKIADVDTWMALLLSKGNPSRSAISCDTNVSITNHEQIQAIKSEGYTVIGRYLTGSSKGLTIKEENLLLSNDISFFPIFEESGIDSEITYFSINRANQDSVSSLAAAKSLGLPQGTIIYFAVDFDPTDSEIKNYVLPYFNALSKFMGSSYKIGVYGTRNVCSKVMGAGYAVTCFVSDMSTGYSGNMGFKMPYNWNFDQFSKTTITDSIGEKINIDKVSYNAKFPTVTSLDIQYDKNGDPITITPKYTVTEGEFVLDLKHPSNIGTARLYDGNELEINITVTGEKGEKINDGVTGIAASIDKTDKNSWHFPMDIMPRVAGPLYANGTTYTAHEFGLVDRDNIHIDNMQYYYLKYDLLTKCTKNVRIKVLMKARE